MYNRATLRDYLLSLEGLILFRSQQIYRIDASLITGSVESLVHRRHVDMVYLCTRYINPPNEQPQGSLHVLQTASGCFNKVSE